MSSPLVSIYIPTHNRVNLLKRAVESVQKQTIQDIEILICDDASSDDTFNYCQNLVKQDQRIKYFRNETAQGACVARNKCIFNASGMFITGLDDDDEFTNDRIEFCLEHWNDQYSFLCCNFINRYINKPDKSFYKTTSEFDVFSYKDILFENYASNQMFTLTSRMKAIGGFDTSVKRLQDWDTWLKLAFEFGEFIRYNHCTYIMYNDQEPGDKRVSNNLKITEALRSFLERNKKYYSDAEARYLNFLISNLEHKSKFRESVYWTLKNKNIKFLVKYVLQ